MSVTLHRHVKGLVADLAAEYGEIDLIGRRVECSVEGYDRLLAGFESFDVVGGAGVRVLDGDRMLLVRYEGADGWVDPGDSRRPGESYRECATRGLREAAGVDATIDRVAQIHLLYLDDPTDREPIPNPYVSFLGTGGSGSTDPGPDVESIRWSAEPPGELLYDELGEQPLGG